MRLDKYLKASGLAKRRAVAKKLCDAGRVKLNDRPGKASAAVRVGDTLEVRYGNRGTVVEVTGVPDRPPRKGPPDPYFVTRKHLHFASPPPASQRGPAG